MGTCKHCKKSAGFLSKKHKECENKFQSGKSEIILSVKNTIVDNTDLQELVEEVNNIATSSYINDSLKADLLISGLSAAIEHFLDDGIIDRNEEDSLNRFTNFFDIQQEDLNQHNLTEKIVKALVLRDVVEGEIISRFEFDGNMPFIFQKSEQLLWAFNNVNYYQQRTRTTYRGGYNGVSIKVAKGVYYKTGGFRGEPVQHEENKYIGTGLLALTSKHLYFHCPEKGLKVPFNKIISMETYQNAIGIQKDGVTAKPMIFENVDNWLVYNIISNLNN